VRAGNVTLRKLTGRAHVHDGHAVVEHSTQEGGGVELVRAELDVGREGRQRASSDRRIGFRRREGCKEGRGLHGLHRRVGGSDATSRHGAFHVPNVT
jgi:hypothetical protein